MNNKAQFTPGPWEHRGNRVYRKDSYEVAWIAGQGPHSEWQANGKLIAAAPAMYAWIARVCKDGLSFEDIKEGRALLSQAEGVDHA